MAISYAHVAIRSRGVNMPRSDIAISSRSPSVAAGFRHYVASGSWRCPAGGAHKWIHIEGDTWRCTKCLAEKVIKSPDYAYNDRISYNLVWGAYRDIDALKSRA